MPDKTIRVFDGVITRRDAVKAGGIAGLGLAFSRPLVRTLRPANAFGQASYTDCRADRNIPTVIASQLRDGIWPVVVQDSQIGLSSITPRDLRNMTAEIPAFAICATEPVTVILRITDRASGFGASLIATDCCGNQNAAGFGSSVPF